jgi:putative hydrolase of the HAD superfamily
VTLDAVLFDWGGTLTPVHSVDALEVWGTAAKVLCPDRVREGSDALLAAEREVWQRATTTMRSATTAEVFDAAASALGMAPAPTLHADALAAYLGAWTPGTMPHPDAADVLRGLRGLGLRTGLLSNTHWPREWHERWLQRDGLLDLLDARVYTSDLEFTKPHPSAFQSLLDAVGVVAERSVFVGDRLHDDISGARAVGMRTVWVRNDVVPSYDVEPDATIDGLRELLAVIDGWRG